MPGEQSLTAAVARYYFKLLAVKDEYEVARLYAESDFRKRVAEQFDGDYKLVFHLAPPLVAKPDAVTGVVKKRTYGPWMMKGFALLAKLRGVRGTALDPFGKTAERRRERALPGEYEALLTEILGTLAPHNHALAVLLASVPEHIRGYGHVKEKFLDEAKKHEAHLLAQFRAAKPTAPQAAIKVAA